MDERTAPADKSSAVEETTREGGNGNGHACAGSNPVAPPNMPCFPDPSALDEALYDYLRRSDKMGWSPYDLIEHDGVIQAGGDDPANDHLPLISRADRITEYQLGALKTVLYVEDHLPGYLSEYLRIMTDPDVPDEQQIVNRKTLRFTFRWVAEEDRHSHVLQQYLVRTGLVSEAELEADMLRERRTAYVFPYHQMAEGFVYLALQEKATHLYYRALAKELHDPLLKAILTRMGADEASHGAFFYDMLIKSFKGDLDALSRRISAVANDFKMPVQSNLLNYRRQLLGMMRAAPSYKHGDCFADMMKAVERASQRYGSEAMHLITPDLAPFDKD